MNLNGLSYPSDMNPGLGDRGKTAMMRTDLSRPIETAIRDGVLDSATVFDYGCGRGGDVVGLRALGYSVTGWDPVHAPKNRRKRADVVNLGYVVNVIEDPDERRRTLIDAWALTQRALIVAARLSWEPSAMKGRPHGDGLVTARGTFQKYFSQEDLRAWIDSTLDCRSVAAAPGIFYVFRSESARQAYAASQFLTRRAVPQLSPTVLLDGHRGLLQPLITFLDLHGRVPSTAELSNGNEVAGTFGSIDRAYRIISEALGTTTWEATALKRQRDLLVYVALSRFGRRPKFSDLPVNLRQDIKTLFGSYRTACQLGDGLLFSCGQRAAIDAECRSSAVGKLTPDALYVHVSVLEQLSPLLRSYEGCARALIGAVDGATLVKMRRDKPKVSYLLYPTFDSVGHPPLRATYVVDLASLRTYHKDYSASSNPPILHRKETFVGADYPNRDKFQALTEREEEAGLLDHPELIGFAEQWTARLIAKGLRVRGNSLVDVATLDPRE